MTVINLNKVRKARELLAKKTQADQNAAKFGRSKAERLATTAQETKARIRLDQLKFEDD